MRLLQQKGEKLPKKIKNKLMSNLNVSQPKKYI